MKPSGIGGHAVIEGIMMRNKDKYSIAVRKPDNDIEVTVRDCKVLTEKHKWMGYPIIRGVVSFIDSLVTGISTINYSASFYDDPEEQKKTKADEIGKSLFKDKFESVLMAFTVILSVFIAVGLFMLLPYFVSRLVKGYVASKTLLNFIEGLVRVAIFILYLLVISLMKDIKRTFMYHGAEHKCINCIENGARLTTENVMNSSRYHKRCGTSFLFIVMFISVVFFIFIRVDNTALQIVIRLLLVPVIAGVSYEFIRWAGKNDNGFTMVLSKPGMWLQKLTTREPDEDMVEVAIGADLCSLQEAEDFLENVPANQKWMGTSCCPAWSVMAKKTLPEYAHYISMSLTPMVLTARMIKKQHPECKVVFIGPCAAKKLEASRHSVRSDVDFVLTFEETMGLFDAKAVDFKSLEVEEPLQTSSALGKGFASSGGVAQAVVKVINEMRPDMEVKTVKAEGLAECKKMLMMAKAGRYDGYLLEGMACPGGCVGGAGVLSDVRKTAMDLQKDMARSELKDPTETQYKDYLELITSED